MTSLIVALSGSAGAVARYLVAGRVQRRVDPDLPVGTALVNLIGAFALGLVVGLGIDGRWLAGIGGALAGFTTYSTWMVEVVALTREGSEGRLRAAVDLVGLMSVGLALAWVGVLIGRWLV